MQQQAQTGLNDIANQVAAGTMTQQQALQGLSDLANSTQQSFNELLEQSLPVLQNYIPGHPQFELDGLSQAMQYMVSHPDAISQMCVQMKNCSKMWLLITNSCSVRSANFRARTPLSFLKK